MKDNSEKTYSSSDINEMLKKMQAMQKRIAELEGEVKGWQRAGYRAVEIMNSYQSQLAEIKGLLNE